jgi:hypothetical protein
LGKSNAELISFSDHVPGSGSGHVNKCSTSASSATPPEPQKEQRIEVVLDGSLGTRK